MQFNIMCRKALYVFLSCWLVLFTVTPSFAVYDPNAKHSKWFHDSIVNDPLNKSTVRVEAQRTYPVAKVDPKTNQIIQNITKNQKTSVKVLANVNKVGKTLMKRNPVGAIGQAVVAILGKSVDWVLDPENNSIKYKDDGVGAVNPDGTFPDGTYPPGAGYLTNRSCSSLASTKSASCSAAAKIWGSSGSIASDGRCFVDGIGVYGVDLSNKTCVISSGEPNAGVDSEGYKSIPISQVAQKVIDQAAEGQAPAMQVMSDTALDALEAGELDNDLEAAADPKEYGENEYPPDSVPTPNPDTGTDPDGNTGGETPNPEPNPDAKPTEWPAFCDWATLACDYYSWSMAAWEPPEGENNEVTIQDVDIGDWQGKATASYVQFNGQCPADVNIPINYMGASTNLSISYGPFCHFASMIKPAVILGAWISAMLIISGGRAKES